MPISTNVFNGLGNCLVQAAFWVPQGCFCLTLWSLPLPSSSFWEQTCEGWEHLRWGQKPLDLERTFSSGEGFWSMPADANRKICTGSHWVGFWPVAWLSDCDVMCLQWQTGTRRRADCGLPGSWEVVWCSRKGSDMVKNTNLCNDEGGGG